MSKLARSGRAGDKMFCVKKRSTRSKTSQRGATDKFRSDVTKYGCEAPQTMAELLWDKINYGYQMRYYFRFYARARMIRIVLTRNKSSFEAGSKQNSAPLPTIAG